MTNELIIKDDMKLSVTDVKKYIAPNATDKEIFMFMGIAKSFGLNPFKREIHFIKYGNAAASIIVGYEQYLKRAERTGKLDGWKCWIEKDQIGEKAVIEIKRKDQTLPIKWEVYRNEFDKQQSTWKSMPTFMLKKVAIAQGFRLAFPDDLGGMPYIPEEMPQDKGGGVSELLPVNGEDVVDTQETTTTAGIVEPAQTSQATEHNSNNVVFAKIQEVTNKTGTTNGKAWTAYFIETVTGDKYGTFSETLADIANSYQQSGELAQITWIQGKKGKQLVDIAQHEVAS